MSEDKPLVSTQEAVNMRGGINLIATISNLGDIRTPKDLRVRDAVITDSSGDATLQLWNEDVDKFPIGCKIKLTNGYTTQFNGRTSLNSGKYGKLEIVPTEDTPALEE